MSMLTSIRFGIAGLALIGLQAVASAGTQTLSLTGTNPGGTGGYTGTVSVAQTDGTGSSGKTFTVTWTVGSSVVTGVGMVMPADPNTLSVAYPNGDGVGVVMVKLNGDGTASAEWFTSGATKIGTEAWTPSK